MLLATTPPVHRDSRTSTQPESEEHHVEDRQLLRNMVRIRCIEEVIADVYSDEIRLRCLQMRTAVHFAIGQEATAVGVCAALRTEDVVYSSHRSHAHYLAKGGELGAMVAELYGRETGCAGGRGGSVHLIDEAAGFGASAAILGEMISVATGAAWAFAREHAPRVAVTFFGDGASEEGVFHESLNFAALHRLPVVYVCENNQYSLSSPLTARQPSGTSISGRARGYGIPAACIDGNDVTSVHAAATMAVEHCRAGNGPYLLELDTYRWREHVGPYWDSEPGGRSEAEVRSWVERCPIRRVADVLRGTDPTVDEQIAVWKKEFQAEAHAAMAAARAAPYPRIEDLLVGTYGDHGTYAG
ncbi:thiamine pyrophosphate-dependent dehydrogenase E1 component subunit alpha [Streptomyces johnsoniae]|uniref:Thiamine pyrophosphate-dependent dehydrogenase E1 component subunit alpha n=1 Tax=Streptomyces johnsoniae TaxID=3075532 RepID=A0ABU2S3G8_9ACTN|nr:thiamine pyrophosphate-dependent dehydrogenase E1 component subunit alpha [Streptomyces sp. DSM 41886]MDT0443452.1 thiamine pyrophosphate-dependent dehydrogenase E1 component subunit alpha [Streptomyces sp. DSM 41886]